MSEKHLFNDANATVLRALNGNITTNPNIALIPSLRVTFNPGHKKDHVSVISGGGSGHEPGTAGFVGDGYFTAAVAGDIFASPSAKQVTAAIHAVPSNKGTVLVVTNYTGDNLHFGLASEQANASGKYRVGMVIVGDDVAIGRETGGLVGRRGLAGTMLVGKIVGAAAAADKSFEEVMTVGKAVAASMASVAASLDHCHVAGRTEFHSLPHNTIEVGMGLHNEPGFTKVSPVPSPEDLIAQMLKLAMDESDADRAFVPFATGDEIVLFVNNMGGMSHLELSAVVDEAVTQIEKSGVQVARIYAGSFMTSLNGPGVSLSLLNCTHAGKTAGSSAATILSYVDAPEATTAWVGGGIKWAGAKSKKERIIEVEKHPAMEVEEGGGDKVKVSPKTLEIMMKAACDLVLKEEQQLTYWDSIVGDGDCGETCANGAKATLKAVDEGLVSSGAVIHVLRTLTELMDDACGGTLGAIFSIFLAALTSEVRAEAASNSTVDAAFWGAAAARALATLRTFTAAKVGDRTVMDALIPFVDTLKESADLEKAVEAAEKSGKATADIVKAKLGRSTYVGDIGKDKKGEGIPDPGAMAFVAVVKGLRDGLKK